MSCSSTSTTSQHALVPELLCDICSSCAGMATLIHCTRLWCVERAGLDIGRHTHPYVSLSGGCGWLCPCAAVS